MRLGLSSAAAPRLPLDALLDACGRRGLAALELVCGHAHGVDAGTDAGALEAVLRRVKEHGVRVAALAQAGPDTGAAEAMLRLAARAGVPALLRAADFAPADLRALARVSAGAGGRVLLLHGTDPAAVHPLRRAAEGMPEGAAGLAWEFDPGTADPAAIPAVLRAAGTLLHYVRYLGGGPDASAETGPGAGALLGRLALSHYAGPLILGPGASAPADAWLPWLSRRGGWGCGSRERGGPDGPAAGNHHHANAGGPPP